MYSLETIVTWAKRKGFVFLSSDIYGGFAGVYDFGPLGVELVRKIKQDWWNTMVRERLDIVGLDAGIAMHRDVWEASGHTKNFSDPLVVCRKTGQHYRADHLLEQIGVQNTENLSLEEFKALFEKHKKDIQLEDCEVDDLTEPSFFNLLVESNLGVINKEEDPIYLRGETCQGIYVNFKQVLDSTHMQLPFGIAQIGKAFRNEISPRQFLFRTREFEQMEMQYFVDEKDAQTHFETFLQFRHNALLSLGLKEENLRRTPHSKLVFYAKAATDIEYQYPFGWKELEGIHNRGDYDLTQHAKKSGKKLTYFDQQKNEHIIPHIVETSIGVGRLFLAVLCDAYTEEKLPDGNTRVVMRFAPHIAPIAVAVLPLMKKDKLPEKAKELYKQLTTKMNVMYDDVGSIGKRYRRQDEIGTPYCITIDYDTLNDNTVTIRHRDTMQQERIAITELMQNLQV